MPNIFGKLWRSFLGVPELAAPPDFSQPARATLPFSPEQVGAATERAIDESGIPELIDSLENMSFTYFEEVIYTPWSSNVFSFSYQSQDEKLRVCYCGWRNHRDESKLRYYDYSNCTVPEMILLAKDMATQGSAGGWVWDELRVRGTVCGHQKPYVFLPAISLYHPKNPC